MDMSDLDLAAVEARHRPRVSRGGERRCAICGLLQSWPCDAIVLLDALRAAEARKVQAAQAAFAAALAEPTEAEHN